jgi:excisionase family DNA binding protein
MSTRDPSPVERGAFSKREAAAYIGVSVRRFHDCVRAGDVAFFRVGRRVLFARTDVIAFMQRGRRRYRPPAEGRVR